MKKIIGISFVFIFFSLTFVSADIISINSGGDNGLILNPSFGIEDFFLWANRFPIASNVILNSSLGLNTTNENLTVYYNSYDPDKDPITNITDWRINGNSIAVLNMPFDTRVTSTVTGAIRDYSTYGNNGTLGGGVSTASPSWISGCQIGGCYDFDGVNDYVNMGDPASGILDFGTGSFAISAWIKISALPSTWKSIVNKGASGADGYGMEISSGNSLTCSIDAAGGTNQHYAVTGALVGEWQHFVCVFNRTDKIYGFLNGNLIGSGSAYAAGNNNSISNGNSLVIGSYGGGSWNFNGSIDEVIIFNHSLSPEQVNLIYQAGLAGHSFETIVSQETDRGEVWQVAITPNDVYNDGITVLSNTLTIENMVPYDPANVLLESLNERNESDTDLNCSAYIEDGDDSSLTVYVDWLESDVSQFTQTFTNQLNASLFWTLLDSGNLTLGDVWKCSVRIYDSSDYSNWVDSNEVEIIDITNPNITIISPNASFNYTSLDVDFNISISENENISNCYYDLNGTSNISMWRLNDSYFWYEPFNLIPGNHNVTFWCNDTSNNWGMNFTNFTILDEAAIAILLSPSLAWNVNWTLTTIPVEDENATGNNGPNVTDYYINVSVTAVTADLYVRADGNLTNDALDLILLGNESYGVNATNSSVPNPNKVTMTTDYVKIGDSLGDDSVVYMKFYLDVPAGQPAGIYVNNLEFKAVIHGFTP